jgi:hypothetical protein
VDQHIDHPACEAATQAAIELLQVEGLNNYQIAAKLRIARWIVDAALAQAEVRELNAPRRRCSDPPPKLPALQRRDPGDRALQLMVWCLRGFQ